MHNYESLNFLSFDRLLSNESLRVRESTRQFVDKEFLPLIQKHHREEIFPQSLILRMGEMGFLGTSVDGYGGQLLDPLSYGVMMQELERGDSGLRSCASVQSALVIWPIHAYGSEQQKEKYLPPLIAGQQVGCFGLTEPDAGSDPGGMKTHAKKVDGGYVLNGNKMWITNGCIAEVAVVWAKLDGEIRGFIVETKSNGFSTSRMKGKFSLRASITSELHMQDCFVPDSALFPTIKGLRGPLNCLTQARYGIAWGVLGAANACYDTALKYAQAREIFAQPLAGFQLAQAKLVKMVQEITKAQLLVWQLAQLKQDGEMQPWHVSLAKMNNCKMALEVAREARDMLGANGILDEYPVIRHMLNLESVNTYEGTEDVHRLIIGQQITGIAAFRTRPS